MYSQIIKATLSINKDAKLLRLFSSPKYINKNQLFNSHELNNLYN